MPTTRSLSFCHPEAHVIYQTKRKISHEVTRLTIAYEVSETEIKYQVAFCAPHDNFCKRTGRQKAQSRLRGIPITIQPITVERPLDTIMGDIIANHLPCRWVSADLKTVD